MEGKGGNMIVKLFKDVLLLVFLFIAMSKVGNTKETIDQGGVKLRNGCYTMIVLVKQQDGSILIRTMQDCRGGRPI
jgi:hypothetical protein